MMFGTAGDSNTAMRRPPKGVGQVTARDTSSAARPTLGEIGARRLQSEVEQARVKLSRRTEPAKKSRLGQYLTPEPIAAFMARLFVPTGGNCHLLDAGAGIGSLASAFLNRWRSGELRFDRVEVDTYEIDASLHGLLHQTLSSYQGPHFQANVLGQDFIHTSVHEICNSLFAQAPSRYTHAILNPPYKKITGASDHRLALRRVGVETVNLYSAFVALAIAQLAPGGQLVAILPRSFCNGPYYRSFREYLLKHTAIRHIHLFDSRNMAFRDDRVLQENIIIMLERGGRQEDVVVSTSTDGSFHDCEQRQHPFNRIVVRGDDQQFIHIPTTSNPTTIEFSSAIQHSLADIGVSVSTGPVVDFRLKAHLREMPDPQTVPLLYPCHFAGQSLKWPIPGMKKPNAIVQNAHTQKWLYPNGFYCVVRRFSPKEEKRRIVASVIDPSVFGDASLLGLENHLNVFHDRRNGLGESLARGLAIFLNATVVDEFFRRFNGHTQVNATDLKLMKYPSRDDLIRLGMWAADHDSPTQKQIDVKVESIVT